MGCLRGSVFYVRAGVHVYMRACLHVLYVRVGVGGYCMRVGVVCEHMCCICVCVALSLIHI